VTAGGETPERAAPVHPAARNEAGRQRGERADAARNRRAILRAAEELLRDHEPGEVSVERVAAAAGVAKTTVFHRFGTRADLMSELMLERAEALREAVISGPPPLGPGAPPGERLAAFLDALIGLAARNVGLMTAHEHAVATARHGGGDSEAHPVHVFWHDHMAALITEARPDADADLLAHVLLGVRHSDAFTRLLRDGESARLAACMRQLAVAVTRPVQP
jgi:AcrR family transcriptional regulator